MERAVEEPSRWGLPLGSFLLTTTARGDHRGKARGLSLNESAIHSFRPTLIRGSSIGGHSSRNRPLLTLLGQVTNQFGSQGRTRAAIELMQ